MTTFSWPDVLDALTRGDDLSFDAAIAAMRSIMEGEGSAAQIGGFLLALRAKGETVDEIAGFASAMREFSLKVPVHDGDIVDTCGTGGDRSGTCNISTMAALVAAGAGVRVAKHGNRSMSSQCGSADVLEALGVAIELSPEGVAACIDEAGIGFMFAPAFHPAMRHVGPVRRELGIRTVFNFLGPLTNPAGARRQTIGVSDEHIAPKIAAALVRLGTARAMVFRGDDGIDELSITTTSRVWDVTSSVDESKLDPSVVGIERAVLTDLHGGDATHNAGIARALFDGAPGPVREAVCLNASAALVVAGVATDLHEGIERARASIDSGAATRALTALVDVSQRVKPA